MTAPACTRNDGQPGELAPRPVAPCTDAELLHGWVTRPRSVPHLAESFGRNDLSRVRSRCPV